MSSDINNHNMIMKAFEKSKASDMYCLKTSDNFTLELGGKVIENCSLYVDLRTRIAFYNFRDGFEAGYLMSSNEKI